jgi:cytochrome P450
MTALVSASVDGQRLTSQEIASFFILLAVAGVETTRTALAHALELLTLNDDQRRLLLSDLPRYLPGAVEEILRYTTPVAVFRRTLTQDYRLRRQLLKRGDKVLLFLSSANRDETIFTHPDTFDITRSPNPHVAFGGSGPHYCLGASLARRELMVMLHELYSRYPSIRSTGPSEPLLSGFINGIKHLPYSVGAKGRNH